MEEIQDYTLITTVAVCLLILAQIVFIIMGAIILARLNKVIKNVKQTSDMGKDFVRSLREEQLRRVPLWRLGLFAYKRARALRSK